jgi:hypothetical protein
MRDPIASALRTAKGYGRRYAEGGDVDPEALAFEPGESWTPPPEPLEAGYPEPPASNKIRENVANFVKQSRGAPPPIPAPAQGQSLTEYHPTAAEKMGAFFAGEHGEHSHLADVAIGNRGLGSPGGVLGYSPILGQMLQAQEGVQHGDITEAGLAIAPAAKGPKPPPSAMGRVLFDLSPNQVKGATPLGGSLGTSKGSVFTGFADGIDRYVKEAKSLNHAKQEVLTSKLYEAVGVPVAKNELTQLNGKPAVSSHLVSGDQLSHIDPSQYEHIGGLEEHMPADAWLANGDVIGAGIENPKGNILVSHGERGKPEATRIDFGGALGYSGLGTPKPEHLFGNSVAPYLKGLRDESINPTAAEAFHSHVIGPENETAQRIAALPDQVIRDNVDRYGPTDAKAKKQLADKIIARRDDIAKQYGIESKPQLSVIEGGKPDVPVIGKKGATTGLPASPKSIADAMMKSYGESADPAHDMSEVIWKLAEKHGHQSADSVVKQLPQHLWADIDDNLSAKAHYAGYNPWPEARQIKPQAPQSPLPPTKIPTLMEINKKHDLAQVIHSIKKQEMPVLGDKAVTPKQMSNIADILLSKKPKQIAETMMDAQLTSKQADNVLSWLNPFVKKQVDDHYDSLLGGGLKPEEMFEKTFKQGINANKPHWFGKFQEGYQKFYQSLKNFYTLPGKSAAKREADRIAGGFTTPAYSGIRPEHGNVDPFHESSQFHSNMLDVAHAYSVYKNEAVHNKWWDVNHPSVLSEYEHAAIQPLWLDTRDYVKVDAEGHSFQTGNDRAWDARKAYFDKTGKEAKGAIIENVHDMPMGGYQGGYQHPSGNPFTVYQSWDPSTRRSKWARFDKSKFGQTGLHLSLAGGMIGGMGLAGTRGNGVLIDKNQPSEGFASGGSVKVPKASVNYSKGMQERHCGICTFYRDKTCSKVQGPIDWSMWCKLYKAKE